jgi:hypothetical protein
LSTVSPHKSYLSNEVKNNNQNKMADDPPPFSFETFDTEAARVSQSHIASRLTTGPKDADGRFRVTKGMSSLSAAEDVAKKTGITLQDHTKAISCNVTKRYADNDGGSRDREAKKLKKAEADKAGLFKCVWFYYKLNAVDAA